MRARIRRTLTAWLCLLAACLTGLAPARGLVLCLEEDGCISLEMKSVGTECGGCAPHAGDEEGPVTVSSNEGQGCPCIDLHVSDLRGLEKTAPRLDELRPGADLVPPPTSIATLEAAFPAGAHVPVHRAPPRAAAILPHIRSVVLLR